MMFYRTFKRFALLVLLAASSLYAQAQPVGGFGVKETPDKIRFEQYTGVDGNLAFWRLPITGVDTFPGSSCLTLYVPADKPEQTSRIVALYLFAKTNGKEIFYYFNTQTCLVVSFGIDG